MVPDNNRGIVSAYPLPASNVLPVWIAEAISRWVPDRSTLCIVHALQAHRVSSSPKYLPGEEALRRQRVRRAALRSRAKAVGLEVTLSGHLRAQAERVARNSDTAPYPSLPAQSQTVAAIASRLRTNDQRLVGFRSFNGLG